jgi:hypothetical protein
VWTDFIWHIIEVGGTTSCTHNEPLGFIKARESATWVLAGHKRKDNMLTVAQLMKKCTTFHETLRFITMISGVHQWLLSSVIHFSVYNNPQLNPLLIQMKSLHTITTHFCKVYLNIIQSHPSYFKKSLYSKTQSIQKSRNQKKIFNYEPL